MSGSAWENYKIYKRNVKKYNAEPVSFDEWKEVIAEYISTKRVNLKYKRTDGGKCER